MTTAYSAFFSSGLLAAPHNMYNSSFPSRRDEPSRSSSMLSVTDAIDDTSDVELDRSATPTPGVPAANGSQPQPRLRRRRSSLTIGTSPMTGIKSPSRSVGNALQLQRHLLSSPVRSRSDSVGSDQQQQSTVNSNIASEGNSLYGRMRSGSVGTVLKSRRAVRDRRVPGPSFPPPNAPLPPLPPIPSLPGRPSRAKSFSLIVPPSATQALAQKLSPTDVLTASPTLLSPRQPFGDLQLHGYSMNDQEMRD